MDPDLITVAICMVTGKDYRPSSPARGFLVLLEVHLYHYPRTREKSILEIGRTRRSTPVVFVQETFRVLADYETFTYRGYLVMDQRARTVLTCNPWLMTPSKLEGQKATVYLHGKRIPGSAPASSSPSSSADILLHFSVFPWSCCLFSHLGYRLILNCGLTCPILI